MRTAIDHGRANAIAASSPGAGGDATFYLGRQPIVGRQRELLAYELLFRSSTVNAATITDDVAASATVIQHAFADLGMAAALGDRRGYINISEGLLMSNVIEALPPERVALEILETVRISPAVVERCRALKDAGYTLVLDDVVRITPETRAILPLIDTVKLDLMALPAADIAGLVATLRPYHVRLLAEKVETQDQYED